MATRFKNQIRLQERANGVDRIDREAGIIYGVRIISPNSKNGRTYESEALKKAIPLYEGAKVYIDHQDEKSTTERRMRERWGVLQNVREGAGGGLDGDLAYLKTHPMTDLLVESAERFSDFGLSHDAYGRQKKQADGTTVIYEIYKVNSVDVVDRPATTRNLYESERAMKRKLFAVLREHATVKPADTLLARLQEMDGMFSEESPMPDMAEDAGELSPEDAVSEAIKAAVCAICDNKSLALADKVSKIKALLQAEETINGGSNNQGNDAAMTESLKARVAESEAEIKQLKESLQAERAAAAKKADEAAVEKLLRESNRNVTPELVSALVSVPVDQRAKLIEQMAPAKQKPGVSGSRLQEQEKGDVPEFKSTEDMRKFIG